ncbi:single-stranded-DNA-specific exonuclease RecJ [Clostridium fallax]|uniref:Single-stranded-DNA-specific exonuclease RecJ n=1 Tax=Clostridium fallax TaxID=1533 RepID=A0A1M4UNH5_9CLOT|nr:single-stranded-DNA-specific exonuclease RecJ [Clostridium fallax]SHE58266.1 exonuclease RecJ [Clostridium fallax]SQB07660.1 single-stranded-DNA-specific exonuclease RecJ [Clostridium fallax]
MKEKWLLIGKSEKKIKRIVEKCNISPFIARLLVNRGIEEEKDVKRFLFGDIEDLYSGNMMKDMDKGISIIEEAIKLKKKIIIYGDYDCDGVISTVILYKTLKECGANFNYYIPNREDEGYGMNSNRIKILKEEGYEVIITCDNGIAAFDEINYAKELGFQVVITDHHDIPFKENEEGEKEFFIPNGDAIINPKRKDCGYPFKKICGAGVALKFSKCLFDRLKTPKEKWTKLIEYCAIATVCDVVDLIDENRIIVKEGLKLINSTENLGLKALIKATNLANKKISAYHLGFVIGPCINATGRLETADLSVELLITQDENKAENLAKELYELNKKRQDLTTESVEQIIEQIERNKMEEDKVLLIYNDYVHESIAGIVAGRIRERYNVPSIVITKGKDMPKGSGRSIEEYDMFYELSKCKDLMSKFGGHPMAAGLSLEKNAIEKLRKKLLDNCTLTEEDLMYKIRIDLPLSLKNIDENLIKFINLLEPFGKGNPSPIFGAKGVEVKRVWLLGKEKNIVKFRCKINDSNNYIDCISFDRFQSFKNLYIEKFGEERFNEIINTSYCSFYMDFIFYPQINEFNGNRNIQLVVKNLRL